MTLRAKGVTVWSFLRTRVGLAATGALAAAMIAAACLAIPVSQAAQPPHGTPRPGTAHPRPSTTSAGTVRAAHGRPSAGAVTGLASSGLAGPMVALGDSYTAGAVVPLNTLAQPPGCLRSERAYPELVAATLGAQLTNVACTNAGVDSMTAAQSTYLGTNPAQLDALAPDDALVVLTLSGDDIGFLNVLKECMGLSFTDPWGSPCEGHYTSGGTDQIAARVRAEGPKIAAVLGEIKARAPQAKILLVGYPDMFPQQGGCWPAVPITSGDIAYLRGIELQVNAMLAAEAQAMGATYVDTYTPTIGHDFCQPESVRDVEGLIPGSLELPFHPNARGQQAIAAAVLQAL